MPLIHYNHVIDQVTAAAANPSLSDAILPRTSEAGPLGLDAEAFHCVDHLVVEVCCTVEDQVTRDRIVWKGFTQLLDDPRAGRVFGDAAAQDSAPIMRDYEETVQYTRSPLQQWLHGDCSETSPI